MILSENAVGALGCGAGRLARGGLLSLAWLIGIFALGVGVTLIFLAFRVRGQNAGQSSRVT